MRRATACFSMYSLMSMRTMACSSSKRNSASARAVSVLPTPVGPRKINEPMGRLGSLRPARERRMAFATTLNASSWPTTRSRRRSSIWTSFFTSPSSMRETGMPVHLLTIFAILNLSGAFELALAGLLFGLEAQCLDFLLGFGDTGDRLALFCPACPQSRNLFLGLGQDSLHLG